LNTMPRITAVSSSARRSADALESEGLDGALLVLRSADAALDLSDLERLGSFFFAIDYSSHP
jgi:hypothetical protein